MSDRMFRPRRRFGLLASSSLAALLMGGGVPAAWAGQCQINDVGVSAPMVSNAGAINCINIQNSTVNGNVTNTGTGIITATGTVPPTLTGITINNSTINGSIVNNGSITSTLSPAGNQLSTANGILVTNNASVSGGISNAGTISVVSLSIVSRNLTGILVGGVANTGSITIPTFAGGISNAGTISLASVSTNSRFGNGILVGGIANSGSIAVSAFIGGINNSGTISAVELLENTSGILVGGFANTGSVTISNFSGGISNAATGTISVRQNGVGILVGGFSNSAPVTISTFAGGISNAGMISSSSGAGIFVGGYRNPGAVTISNFSGGITNSGTINAAFAPGIFVGGFSNSASVTVSNFSGGISNAGTISVSQEESNGILVGAFRNTGAVIISNFSGGITNSGTISVPGALSNGILVGGSANANAVTISTFSGGISNFGTISLSQEASNGILVGGFFNRTAGALTISTFSGGITNSGTISTSGFASTGIFVGGYEPIGAGATPVITVFSGGISNAGTISGSAQANNGILVGGFDNHASVTISTFAGGISNSGTISLSGGQNNGILVGGFSVASPVTIATFTGGISNSGTIAATSNGIVVGAFAIISSVTISNFSGGITNSGTITAGGAGILVGGAGVTISTFSGNIANSGHITAATGIAVGSGVTFAPGSAIVNTGTIIGTNAAIDVSGATMPVTIDQAAGLLSGAVKLSANADVLNISGGTINGNIVGQSSGTINFALGSGTFTYGPGFGFTAVNQVNVNSGKVILDGTNDAAGVTVNGGTLQVGDAANTGATLTITGAGPLDVAGGTLAGHGTIAGNVTVANGATLMPGGSIGTLTINGNLMMSSGSTYAVEFAQTQASKTQVNGAATLGGATVDAIVTANQFGQQHVGNTYTILTATTPLGAGNVFNPAVTFGGLPAGQKILLEGKASLTYDANDVFLTVPNYTLGLAPAANASLNAQNAANGINSFLLAGGTLPSGFQNLGNLSGNALGNALNQLAGQSQGSFAPVGFEAGSQFLNLMLNPYIDGRPGLATSSPPLAYAEQSSSAPAANAFSAIALGPRPFFEPRLSFWASAYGGDGRISGNAATGAASTNSQIYGAVTGIDYLALPNTIFGLALGGGGTAWQLGQGMGNGHSDMFQAGAYGRTQFGPAYVSGALAYSLQDVTTNRSVTLAGPDTLQGNFAANVLSARLEGGYRLPYGVVAVTPYAALQTQELFLPAYSEFATTGLSQFALSYTSQTVNATRSEIGAWFDSDALMANGIKLYGRLAWAHDFDNEGLSTAFFQSLPGTSFLINSTKPARDGALTTVGFEYKLADGWSVLGKFDGEFSSTTAIFAGTGTIRKVW